MMHKSLLALALFSTAVIADPAFIATQHGNVKIETIATDLAHPWGITVLPDGRLLVTERDGRLRFVEKDGKLSAPISGLPDITVAGQGGLLDVLADKDFATNQTVYLSFTEPGSDKKTGTAVAKATLNGAALTNLQVIFSQTPKVDSRHHFGGRLVQQQDGNLFVTMGDRGSQRDSAQDLTTLIGKVAHITPQGTAASASPFTADKNAQPLIWSYGHRNIQGAALDNTGRLWTHEHGPQGGDEINITVAGKNYGWPVITYGEEYGGGVIGSKTKAGLEQPLHYWVPSIAPSGMLFYRGTLFSKWQNNLLVGSLKFGQLVRLEVNNDKVVHEERIRIGARIRDVEIAPDGAIYLLTDEDKGSVLRLMPAG